jgi:hypothetical protein
MNNMQWISLPSPFPDMKCWGAVRKPFQYVISYDEQTLKWNVSSKEYPNATKRHDIGEYNTRADAELACVAHWSINHQ